jgi:hypothetical protein
MFKKQMPPKKKSVSKATKRPVGRPRKNLGTRVSDIPLVSTIKPAQRRANVDALALQRAKMQFKRDYPGVNVDEYQTRALLDAMQDPSRGPIGSRVLGPGFKTVYEQQLEKEREDKKLDAKLKKAKAKGKPVVVIDGTTYIDPKAISRTIAGLPASIAAATSSALVPFITPYVPPSVPPTPTGSPTPTPTGSPTPPLTPRAVPKVPKGRRINIRSMPKKVRIAKKPITSSTKFQDTKEGRKALEQYNTTNEKIQKLNARADALEKLGKDDEAKGLRYEASNLTDVAQSRYANQKGNWEQKKESIVGQTSGLTAEEKEQIPTEADAAKAMAIWRKFTVRKKTEAEALKKAAEGLKELKKANPAVLQEVQKLSGSLFAEEEEPTALTGFEKEFAEREAIAKSAQEEAAKYQKMADDALALQRADANFNIQDLAELAEQGDTSYTRPTREQRLKPKQEALSALAPFIKRKLAMDALRAATAQEEMARADARSGNSIIPPPPPLPPRPRPGASSQPSRSIEEEIRERVSQLPLTYPRGNPFLSAADEDIVRKRESLRGPTSRKATDEATIKAQLSRLKKADKTQERGFVPFTVNEDPLAKALAARKLELPELMIQKAIRDQLREEEELRANLPEQDERRAPLSPEERARRREAALARRQEEDVEEADFTDEFAREDDAVRQLQAALRRFGDRSRFAKAREIEAEYEFDRLAREYAEPDIPLVSPGRISNQDAFNRALAYSVVVPGSSTRQNNRQAPISHVVNDDREARMARKMVNYAVDRAATEMAVTAANKYIDPAALLSQRSRLKPPAPRIATEEDIDRLADTVFDTALQRALQAKFANTRQEEDTGDFDTDLADRIRRRNEDTERLLQETTGSGLVGGVLRRLRGMGFFDGFDSLSYNIHGTPDDNKKDLAEAKAAYAARGGTFDGRTDFRVLMDAMKTLPRRQGGSMGGSVVLSGSPLIGSGKYTLQAVTFPDTDWKSSSSLRWLRSNGIKPIKKADRQGSLFRYRIVDPKGFKDYYTSELMSRGRKINLVYGSP